MVSAVDRSELCPRRAYRNQCGRTVSGRLSAGAGYPDSAGCARSAAALNPGRGLFLDISALAQWTQKLQKQAAQNIQIHGATITMHVQAEAGQRLLTTVPSDKGWHAEIDGQPAAVTPFQNTFIELPLSEGTHEIKLIFRPRGLTLGLVITAGGVLTALACARAERKKRTEKSRL